jgi:hypothetical protein
MGDIYRNAKYTLMWLGEGTEETRDTLLEIFAFNARRVVENTDQEDQEVPSTISDLIQTMKAMEGTVILTPMVTGTNFIHRNRIQHVFTTNPLQSD